MEKNKNTLETKEKRKTKRKKNMKNIFLLALPTHLGKIQPAPHCATVRIC
jgi:hypothetical protein